jgi:hypothetical protein
MLYLCKVVLLFALSAGSLDAQTATRELPGAEGEWVLPPGATLIAPYRGREALWVRGGPRPYRQDIQFLEGTIEFDVAPLPGASFVGVSFRRESRAQYETVYFRPGSNGQWDAVQYMPRVGHGSQWQLYPQLQAATELPAEQWTHVRVVVEGDAMRLFVGGSSQPTLEVARLRGVAQPGTVGFWASGAGDNWIAVFSNVVIHAAAPSGDVGSRPMTPPPSDGFITAWQAGPVMVADSGPVLDVPNISTWTAVTAEEAGLVNLSRLYGQPEGRNTVFLRHRFDALADRTVPLDITYSDEVTVFLNGRPLYSGVNRWQGRYPGSLGSLAPGTESVYLPLVRGRNELTVAVTDDAFGWGLIARMPPGTDLNR